MDLTVSKIPIDPELHLQHLGASLLVVRRQEKLQGTGAKKWQEAGQKEGQDIGQMEGQGAGR